MLTWDRTLFEELYSGPGWTWGVRGVTRLPRFHYHRFVQEPRLRRMVGGLLAQPGFAQVSHVAIMGGAFGWSAEVLAESGITAISVDTGDYVVAERAGSEEAELRALLTAQGWDADNLAGIFIDPNDPNSTIADPWPYWVRPSRATVTVADEDLSTTASRRNVRQALSNNMDGILTEFLLDGMETDAEALVIAERAEQLRPNSNVNVVHLVGGGGPGDPRLVTKTLQGWKDLLVANGFNHAVALADGTWL